MDFSEQFLHTAEAVSVSNALSPVIAYYLHGNCMVSPATIPAADALTRTVFPFEVLQEITNTFSYFMNTCINTNHIKACFCLALVGYDPQIFIATNQAYYEENAKGLERGAATIKNICRLLADITPANAHSIRVRVLAIVAEAAWARISHHFGLSCQARCGKELDKAVNIPELLPEKLADIIARLEQARLSSDEYSRMMEDMAKLIRTLRRAFQIVDSPTSTTKHPDGTGVREKDMTDALEAVYAFYKTYDKLLKEVLLRAPPIPPQPLQSTSKNGKKRRRRAKNEPVKNVGGEGRLCDKDLKLIGRFENLCPYVDGVNFLCNVALGYVEPGQVIPPHHDASRHRSQLDTTKITDWFRRVQVVPYNLPQEAFYWGGEPRPPQDVPHAAACPPTDAADQAALDHDQRPESPSSPAPSVGSHSVSPALDDAPEAAAVQEDTPTLLGVLAEHGLDAMHRVWSDRKPPPKDNRPKKKSRRKKQNDEEIKFAASYNSALGRGVEHQPKIHAEIILLFKVEELMQAHGWRLDDSSAPAIYIASSKKACYCCHKLILASKMKVIPPPSHAIVYPSWRLPDARYVEQHAPMATEWPAEFRRQLWDILRAALSRKEGWQGEVPARDPSEDISLRTFPGICSEAYSIDHWATPAAPQAAHDASLCTAEAPTLDPKGHKRPADASRSASTAGRRKRAK